MPVFIQNKGFSKFLIYSCFCKKFILQMFGPQLFHCVFSNKLKNYIKVVLILLC